MRYYSPDQGRWINRDPLREASTSLLLAGDHTLIDAYFSAAAQLTSKLERVPYMSRGRLALLLLGSQGSTYHFTRNHPIGRIDPFGLNDCDCFDFKLYRGWCEWGWGSGWIPYVWRCFADVPWDGVNPENPRAGDTVSFSIEPKCTCDCKDTRAWVETWHTSRYDSGEQHWPFDGGVYECNFGLENRRICNILGEGGPGSGIIEVPHCFIAIDDYFEPGTEIRIRWGTGSTTCGTLKWDVVR